MRKAVLAFYTLLAVVGAKVAEAQSLRGSAASLTRQNRQAQAHNYSYLDRPADVQRFVRAGLLVPIRGNGDYELAKVSFPYARPEVKIFLERLGRQYRAACGEALVVTSLVRPNSHQPANASDRSVHPTGMAIDLRRPRKPACRQWLERVLLQLEGRGVLEATLERRPPHYHIALFPKPYLRYIGGRAAPSAPEARVVAADPGSSAEGGVTYTVRRGDSLWLIARRHGTTVRRLKEENGLQSSRVLAGQVLRIPPSEGR
jgi:hypothetical protein